jgi:hypothetical protein
MGQNPKPFHRSNLRRRREMDKTHVPQTRGAFPMRHAPNAGFFKMEKRICPTRGTWLRRILRLPIAAALRKNRFRVARRRAEAVGAFEGGKGFLAFTPGVRITHRPVRRHGGRNRDVARRCVRGIRRQRIGFIGSQANNDRLRPEKKKTESANRGAKPTPRTSGLRAFTRRRPRLRVRHGESAIGLPFRPPRLRRERGKERVVRRQAKPIEPANARPLALLPQCPAFFSRALSVADGTELETVPPQWLTATARKGQNACAPIAWGFS